jgi:potassium-dependent mechanosensitive channel
MIRLHALVLAVLLAPAVGAQAPVPPLRQQVQDAATLEEARRSELLAQLDAAAADRAAVEELRAEIGRVQAEATRAGSESRRYEREHERDPEPGFQRARAAIEALKGVESLEQELQKLAERVEPLRREQQALSASLANLGAEAAGGSVARLQDDIGALEERLAQPADGSLETRAQRDRTQAELERRRAELELAQLRQDSAAARRRVLELRQPLLRRQIAELEQLIALAQARLGERSENELAQLNESLAQRLVELAEAPQLLRTEATRNIALGAEFIAANQRLGELRLDTGQIASERARLEQALRSTESRLALGTDSEAVGAVLLRERQRLPQPELLRRQERSTREDAVRAKLRLFDLADAQSELDARRQELAAQLAEDASSPEEQAAWRAQLDVLLETRSDLLRRLESTLGRLVGRLEQAEVHLERQLQDSLKLKALLDRQLFWIPSHRAVDLSWLRSQAAGWADLLKPSRFATTAELAMARLGAQPLAAAAAMLVLIALFMLQRRAHSALPDCAPPLRRIEMDSYRLTWKALAWTAAAALPWATLAWLGGQWLQLAGEPGRYTHSLGNALSGLAGSIALFTFTRWLVMERGLAHAHFRWTRPRRESLDAAVSRAAWVLLPAQFLSSLAFVRGQDLAIDSAGRSLLIVFAAVGGGLFWWLLAPGRLWSPRGGVAEPVRLRQFMRLALAALLLLILGLTLSGYVFTAGVLVRCLWLSGGALLAVAVLHGLMTRWFLLGERRLALRQAQARRAAAAAEAPSDGELPPETEAEPLDIQSIGAQTQRLVRALAATALVLLLFWVWADILPALQRLDEIALWSFSDTGADGERITAFVSLRAALLGAALLVLTTIAARNLPGLIEIGLLSRIRIDAASRYAITSVARYAIIIIGVIVGLGFLGMRWSQLQWMAAALTVGLGFGLQEIFANFVSGLILLFERPFRVGDIITIGEFTGRVTKIRTRATTILDFDNKEVVIPNKSFITDRLTNWTLTDSMTRVTIRVGVAYGSNVEQVHKLLLQAAAECEFIASEPVPRSWFMAFGASSLDFELRVFVPSIEQRLLAQNALHGRIATLFAEAGIEIAFPQMDLHVRALPPSANAGIDGKQRDQGPPAPAQPA